MKKPQTFNLQNLYKLPWSTYNNPNGWIEPTTYCQLACPGCYRGLSLPNPQRTHENLAKLKKEIDTLVKIRKIKILSVAGGEPLLYPKLNNLLRYAASKGLKIRLVTNGSFLTESRLEELKNLGVVEIVIHLAHYQNRSNLKNEKQLSSLRSYYCQIFRKVKDIELGFIMTVSKNNIKEIPDVLNFYKENSDIISRVCFTRYQDLLFTRFEDKTNYVSFGKLTKLVEKAYQIKPCAYLPKTLSKIPSWLFFTPVLQAGKVVAFADAKTVENLHRKVDPQNWNSFPAQRKSFNPIKTLSYLSPIFLLRIAKGLFFNFLKNPWYIFKTPYAQIIILINPPIPTEKGWDICDGCPDAMMYRKELIPSCLLERIKWGERITL